MRESARQDIAPDALPYSIGGELIRVLQHGYRRYRAFRDFVMEAFRHEWLAKRFAGSLG